MSQCTLEQLTVGKCTPCEGGIAPISHGDAEKQLAVLVGWKIASDGKSISKSWNRKNFVKSLDFCNAIGQVAELEQHHPDLHLTGYRHVTVVLTTHAIGGLSLNDFILAAKIDSL
jgi:4a-hydroxytetrahydrobiopterin dehydratase